MNDPGEAFSLFPGTKKATEKDYAQDTSPPIFNLFSAKRNAGGIEHYFINTRYLRNVIVSVAIFVIIVISMLIVSRQLSTQTLEDRLERHTQEMIDSTQSRISKSILSTIREPFYFSTFFADFFKDSTYTINITNGQLFIKLFGKAHISGTGEILWWDIGTVAGDYFSIESYVPGTQKVNIMYSNGTNDNEYAPLYMWETDENGYNEFFPTSNGTYMSMERLMDRVWYSQAKTRKTAFTDIHQATSQYKSIMMLTNTAPLLDTKNDFIAAFNNGITIEHILNLIESLLPSKNSHLALIASDDVVARDGTSIETYNNTVILQNIQSIEDTEWRTATTDSRFGDSFMYSCTVNGSTLLFSSDVIRLDVVGGTNWELATLLCISDFVDLGGGGFGGKISVFASILSVMFFVTVAFLVASNILYLSIQNRIMRSANHGTCRFNSAEESLKTLKRSHGDKEDVNELVKSISDSFSNDLYYNTKNVAESISNDLIRKVFVEKYINARENSSFYTQRVERETRVSNDIEQSKMRIVDHIKAVNKNFVDEEKLVSVVQETLLSVRQEQIPLIADSFNFILSIASMTCDRCFSVFLCLLSFFMSRSDREKNANSLSTYFEMDLHVIQYYALQLYDKLESAANKETFNAIADMLMQLVSKSPLQWHWPTLQAFISLPNEDRLMEVLCNAAQVSFLYETSFSFGESFKKIEESIRTCELLPEISAIRCYVASHL